MDHDIFNLDLYKYQMSKIFEKNIFEEEIQISPLKSGHVDPYSYAKPDHAAVTSIYLDINVDFDQMIIRGTAILTIRLETWATEVILDNNGLIILSVKDFDSGIGLTYYIDNYDCLGSKFTILLPKFIIAKTEFKIQIEYKTKPNSPVFYWLMPEQTSAATHPFLLFDNQYTHARAMFPCQDTPSVKFNFSAKISVPPGLKVITSGKRKKISMTLFQYIYEFYETAPIPSYAVVLVVGRLRNIMTSAHRINILAEPEYYKQSKKMLSLIHITLNNINDLCGSYLWGTCNICVLPSSISLFEVESPFLILVPPTILDGDNSLFAIVMKSIPYKWTGSIVTCTNYEDLWLNKSFSLFIWRKIVNIMFGNEVKEFLEMKGISDLINTMTNPWIHSELKSLIPNLIGFLPKYAVNYVPYEKGYLLLQEIESKIGGPTVFEPFLKSYINKFKYQNITTKAWKDYLYEYFSERNKVYILKNINLDKLLYDRSDITFLFSSEIKKKIENIYNKIHFPVRILIEEDGITSFVYNFPKYNDIQKIEFLTYLYESHEVLPLSKIKQMSLIYPFSQSNGEIRFLWLCLCIKSRWIEKIISALEFVREYCSSMYACSIFQNLYKLQEYRAEIIQAYKICKPRMLLETRNKLESILYLK